MPSSLDNIFDTSGGGAGATKAPASSGGLDDIFGSSAPSTNVTQDKEVQDLIKSTPAAPKTESFFSKSKDFFGKALSLPGKAIQGAGNLLEKTYGENIERGLAEGGETYAEKFIKSPIKKSIEAGGDLLEKTYGKDVETGLAEGGETSAEQVLKKPAALIGQASPEDLPFGVGDVIAGYKDIYKHPDQYAPVTIDDVLGAIVSTSKDVEKMPIKAAANFAGKPLKFNVPILGEVTNRQFDAARRISSGEDPIAVTAEEGTNSIFDTLILAGLVSEVAGSRPITTNQATMSAEDVATNPSIRNAPEGVKSFKLYNPVVNAQPVAPEILNRMIAEKGFNPGDNFNPDLPTYFKGSSLPDGSIKFEVVQIKPSYFSQFIKMFKPGTPESYNAVQTSLLSSGHDFDRAIESGDVEMNKVFQSPNGELQPQQITHTVNDLAGKLDMYQKGLGEEFKTSVDTSNPTPSNLIQQASNFLSQKVGSDTNVPATIKAPILPLKNLPSSAFQPAMVSQTVDPKAIGKAKNEHPDAVPLHPTLHAETSAALDTHGEDVTHNALQDSLGMSPEQATKTIETVKKTRATEAMANPEKTATETLQKIAPKEEASVVDGIPNEVQEKANKDWEDNFAEAAGERANQISELQSQLKEAKTKDKPEIQKMLDVALREDARIENEFIKKWKNEAQPATTKEKTATEKKIEQHVGFRTSIIENLQDVKDNHPGSKMKAFIDKKTGQFEDFKNPDLMNSKTGKPKYNALQKVRIQARNAKIMKAAESAFEGTAKSDEFDNPDTIRDAIDEVRNIDASIKFHKEMLAKAKKGILPHDDFVDIIEGTPESKKIAQSFTTNFDYNPQSGFINVEPIAKGINNVEDFIKETKKGLKAAGNLDDSLYTLTKESEADKILAVKLTQKLDITPEDAEAIYHFEEDKSLPLTDKQQEIYDQSIKPLADASAKIAHKLKDIIPVESEEYTPRFVAGRGNVIDRIKAGAQGIGGKGSVLGKNAPSLKRRTMKALVDEDGNRSVVSLKDGKITKIEGKKSSIVGYYSSVKDLAKGKYYKNIKDMIDKKPAKDQLNIVEATTKEIERETNLTYHKNVFVNRLITYLNLRQVERATDFLDAYKSSDEFGSIGIKFGDGEAPKNWTTTINPSFRGYMLEPRVANVMDKYSSSMMKGKDPLRALTALNGFLRTAIFFNPLIHIPNIGVHWLVNRGTTAFVNPKAYMRLGKTSARAINAVIHQNDDYVDMLRSGAPLLYSGQSTKNMHNLLLAKMTSEIDKNPALGFLKRGLKALNPYVLSGKATWMINDIATMQAIYEEMETNKELTMEQAIKNVGAHIPNYRLPANKAVDLLTNPNITMFGAYHYGALRSYYEMAKTLVSGEHAANVKTMTKQKDGSYKYSKFGKEQNKARRQVLDKLLMMGILGLVVYPAIDKALKEMTGNPNAKLRRAGAITFPYNLMQVAEGNQDISQFLQSVMTPAVGSKELISQMFNLDLFTGQHIRDTQAPAGEEFREAIKHGVKAIAPVAQYQKLDTGSQSKSQFIAGLMGVSLPDAGKSKLANAIESAQNKVDKFDQTAVARVKPIYEEAKSLGFGTEEADAVVADLDAADYNIYKALKAVDTAKQNLELTDKITPIVREAHDLGFGTEEADALVENLSEDELAAYNKIKAALYTTNNEDATATAPTEWDQQSMIDRISTYASALGEHPIQLFNDMFAGNQSYRILGNENGQLIVARLDEKNSQDIKRQLGGATKEFKLDHTIPLEAGGNNSDDNLQLLTTEQWAENTNTENMIGKALKSKKITGSQAREYIIRFKKGLGEKMSDTLEEEFTKKYGGKTLTSADIQSIIDAQ